MLLHGCVPLAPRWVQQCAFELSAGVVVQSCTCCQLARDMAVGMLSTAAARVCWEDTAGNVTCLFAYALTHETAAPHTPNTSVSQSVCRILVRRP